MMTDAEKVAAFDALAIALTNQWESGSWSWWCPNAAGGMGCHTREEAVADLVAWSERTAKRKAASETKEASARQEQRPQRLRFGEPQVQPQAAE